MKLTGIESLATWKRWLGYGDAPCVDGSIFSYPESLDAVVSYRIRERHIHTRGFPIITKECLDVLSGILAGHTVLDCGAGSGYLTHHLQRQGVEIEGLVLGPNQFTLPGTRMRYNYYGFKRTFMKKRLLKGNYLTHDLSGYSAFILSWPDYSHPAAYQLLQRLPAGALLIYQGESDGGCCADDDFFVYLEDNFEEREEMTHALNAVHCQFFGIHDKWRVAIRL